MVRPLGRHRIAITWMTLIRTNSHGLTQTTWIRTDHSNYWRYTLRKFNDKDDYDHTRVTQTQYIHIRVCGLGTLVSA